MCKVVGLIPSIAKKYKNGIQVFTKVDSKDDGTYSEAKTVVRIKKNKKYRNNSGEKLGDAVF
jgi:hypothetical protein